MARLSSQALLTFAVALGMSLGGAFIGALAALATNESPKWVLTSLAGRLKLWAMVAALGGALDTLRNLETGILGGQPMVLVRQLLILVAAFAGAQAAYLLTSLLAGR